MMKGEFQCGQRLTDLEQVGTEEGTCTDDDQIIIAGMCPVRRNVS